MAISSPQFVRPKRSLGQNFLCDDNIARRIVRHLHLAGEDVVVEIGPGKGSLTKHLVENVRHLLAVEIDRRLVEDLKNRFASDRVTVINQDFLEVPLEKYQHQFGTKLRLVGNIPYHLTSPIIFKVFEERASVKDLTIMVQREVARRLTAKPNTKAYGILSVLTQFYGSRELLFDVSPNCFYPKPKVTSTVVYISFYDTLPYTFEEEIFRTIVKTTFGKRRKTLRNSLQYLPYHESAIMKIVDEVDFPLEKRPEQLTLEQFIELTEQIEMLLQ